MLIILWVPITVAALLTCHPLAIGFVAVMWLIFALGFFLEYRDYNHGKCRYCGSPLESFDCDSQGGRGYKCTNDDCRNTVWVSYPFIDGVVL